MLINFNEMEERKVTGMNGGAGEMTAKMYVSESGKSYRAASMGEVQLVCTGIQPAMILTTFYPVKERPFVMERKKF